MLSVVWLFSLKMFHFGAGAVYNEGRVMVLFVMMMFDVNQSMF